MQQSTAPANQKLSLAAAPNFDTSMAAILRLFSESRSRKEYLDGVVRLLRERSGCRCVGVRVLDPEGNIPYESYLGFSKEFWASENWLSVRDDNCICIRVINGAPEPQDLAVLTAFGSFACGNTFDFVGGLSLEAQGRFRGVCIRTGFASVAVVPITYRGTILGAIHLADERENQLSPEMVRFVETMAPLAGEAVQRFSLEEELRRNHDFQSALNFLLRLSIEDAPLNTIIQQALDTLFSMPWLTFEPRGFIELLGSNEEIPVAPLGHHLTPIRSGETVLGYISLQFKAEARRRRQEEETLNTVADVLSGIIVRKRAQEALRESEAKFRRLAENARDLIYRYELRPSRGFSYLSSACQHLFGYAPEEFYADPDLAVSLAYPDDLPALLGLLEGDALLQPFTSRWRRRDGQIVWTEQRSTPIHDEAGNLVAIEGIARDITERKQMEESLLRAQRLEMAGKVAGQVAHDLNNLISPLVGYPQLIKRHLPEDHPAVQYCDAQLRVARQVAGINEDLLTLGRRGRLKMQPVDLNSLVGMALAEIGDQAGSLRVDAQLASDLPQITAAPSQLLRVITNLISNAREAMDDSGVLTVRTDRVSLEKDAGEYVQIPPGQYVRLTTGDTGCGIPPEFRDRIFDPFFSTKQSGRKSGSGLGLSIVQAVVEDHGGKVDLASEVGRGTTFAIYLPIPQAS